MFSYISIEDSESKNHPLRKNKEIRRCYFGRDVARLLRALFFYRTPRSATKTVFKGLLVQVLFSVRSETQLVEPLR